jgi:hypothetical protein
MQTSQTRKSPVFMRRASSVFVAAVCGAWLSTASADPVCGAIAPTPADGVIAAGTTLNNNQVAACFDNTVTPIVNKGAVNNLVGAGLTSQGSLTVNAGASLWNYGLFHNYSTASLIANGSVRNYAGGVFTNSGTFLAESGVLRNYGQWINSQDATMDVRSTFDNYGGGTLVNNGWLASAEIHNAAGATFENNGYLYDRTEGMSYIQNAGAFVNGVNGNSVIHLLANDNLMINRGRIEVADSQYFRNSKTFNNEITGKLVISGTARNQATGVIDNIGLLQTNSDGELENSGRIENRFDAELYNNGRLENKAGAVLNNVGTMVNNGTLVNDGTVDVELPNTWRGVGVFVQNSGAINVEGTMQQKTVSVFGGVVTGSGHIDSSSMIVQNAEIAADGLSISGYLDIYGATISNTIGATDFTVLNVLGLAYISSATFKFDFGDYVPEVGDSWLFMTGAITGNLDLFVLDILPQGNIAFELEFVAGGLQLTAVEAVPVPAAAWLFGSGLIGLLGARRLRAKHSA